MRFCLADLNQDVGSAAAATIIAQLFHLSQVEIINDCQLTDKLKLYHFNLLRNSCLHPGSYCKPHRETSIPVATSEDTPYPPNLVWRYLKRAVQTSTGQPYMAIAISPKYSIQIPDALLSREHLDLHELVRLAEFLDRN